jgi:hypothetical protein
MSRLSNFDFTHRHYKRFPEEGQQPDVSRDEQQPTDFFETPRLIDIDVSSLDWSEANRSDISQPVFGALGGPINVAASAQAASPTPNPSIQWAGETGPGQGNLNPPDPNIAVGTNNVVTVVNNHIDVYNRNGANLYSQTLNTLFGQPNSNFIYDPRVTWDQFSNRFLVTAGDGTSNVVHLAVSRDSNPLDGWYNYNLVINTGLDQPLLAVDASNVYISLPTNCD